MRFCIDRYIYTAIRHAHGSSLGSYMFASADMDVQRVAPLWRPRSLQLEIFCIWPSPALGGQGFWLRIQLQAHFSLDRAALHAHVSWEIANSPTDQCALDECAVVTPSSGPPHGAPYTTYVFWLTNRMPDTKLGCPRVLQTNKQLQMPCG